MAELFTRRQRGGRPFEVVRVAIFSLFLLTACSQTTTSTTDQGAKNLAVMETPATVTAGATASSTATRSATAAGAATATMGITPASTGGTATARGAAPSTRTPAAAEAATLTPSVAAAVTPSEQLITASNNSGGGGGKNQVTVINKGDERMKIRGNIDLNRIPGDKVAPVNSAAAYSSCTDCQTIAVALQINLISRTATTIAPENYAVAVNEECTRCFTVARALQYTYQVDDPRETPKEVADLIKEMDRTLNEISRDKGISLAEADNRIDAVIAQFRELATSLNDQRREDNRNTGTGTPTGTITTTPAPTGTVLPTTTVTATATSAPATTTAAPALTPTAAPAAQTPTPIPPTAAPPTAAPPTPSPTVRPAITPTP